MMGLILISSIGLSIHHHICFEVQKEYVSISGDNHCDKTEKQSCCNITPEKSSKDDCCASEHSFSKLDIQAKNEKSDIIGHQLLVYVLPVLLLSGYEPYVANNNISGIEIERNASPPLTVQTRLSLLQTMIC